MGRIRICLIRDFTILSLMFFLLAICVRSVAGFVSSNAVVLQSGDLVLAKGPDHSDMSVVALTHHHTGKIYAEGAYCYRLGRKEM